MEHTELHQLVARAMQRDPAAFEELCRQKGRAILCMCVQYMGNQQDAEDAMQEVFLRMHRGLPRLASEKAFSVWMHKIILRTCLSMRKKRRYDHDLHSEELEAMLIEPNEAFIPSAYLETEEQRQVLLDIIHQLPGKDRACILLFYYEGLSLAEIAQVTSSNKNVVGVRLHRAKQKIRARLERQAAPAGTGRFFTMAAAANLLVSESNSLFSQETIERGLAAALAASAAPALLTALSAASVRITAAAVLVVALGAGATVLALRPPSPTGSPPPGRAAAGQGDPQPPAPAANAAPDGSESDRADGGQSFGSGRRPAASATPTPPGPSSSDASVPQADPGRRPGETPEGPQEPPAPDPQPAGGVPTFTLSCSGRIDLAGTAGQVAQRGTAYAEGFVVSLEREGECFATTLAGQDGRYAFTGVELSHSGAYTLRFTPPHSRAPAFDGRNAGGTLPLEVPSGTGAKTLQAGPLLLRDDAPPELALRLLGEDGAPRTLSPARAQLLAADLTDTTLAWQIEDAEGTVLHKGRGSTVEEPFAALAPGSYVLRATATDAAGNRTAADQNFTVL